MDKNNKLDDLMSRGREKRRSNIYKSVVESNRTNGRREGTGILLGAPMGLEFVKDIEFREVLLELRRRTFW